MTERLGIRRLLIICAVCWMQATALQSAELDVKDRLYVATNTVSPFGGIGRYENLLLQSEDLNLSGAWTPNGVSVTPNNAILAPNGTPSAELIQDTATSGTRLVQAATAAAANAAFTASIWLRTTAATAVVTLSIDANGGAATAAEPDQIVTLTMSWQRVVVRKTFGAGSGTARFILDVGANTNILAWGAQLEAAGQPGVYVHTTATPVSGGRGVVSDGAAVSQGAQLMMAFRLAGVGIVKRNIDGGVIVPFNGAIRSVTVSHALPGISSSTIVDINKDGATIFTNQANRPALAFNDPDGRVTVTNMDVTSVSAGDLLTCDIDQIEGGNPEDIVIVVEMRAI